MQLPADSGLATLVTSSSWAPKWSVKIDWGRTGLYDHALSDVSSLVLSATVDRQVANDLPAEATLVQGRQSAELTLQLGGTLPNQTLSIGQTLSGWRSDSPFFRQSMTSCRIKYQLGGTPNDGVDRMLNQFTGRITRIWTNALGVVSITALDAAEEFRQPVTLPPWALSGDIKLMSGARYRWTCNSHWIVDHIFRLNGYNQSPPPPSGAVFAATLHGGFPAEIGWGGTPAGPILDDVDSPMWVTGQFGLAMDGSATRTTNVNYSMMRQFEPGAEAFAFSAWIKYGDNNAISNGFSEADLMLLLRNDASGLALMLRTDGYLKLQVFDSGFTSDYYAPAVVGAAGWHYVGFHFLKTPTGSTVTWRIDGTPNSSSNVHADFSGTPTYLGRLWMFTRVPLQLVYIWATPTVPSWTTTWTSEADIDTGLNEMTALPAVTGELSWEVLKEVAEAEYGVVGMDEGGRPFFKNRNNIRPKTYAPVRVLTLDNLLDLDAGTSVASVRNVITYSAQPEYFDTYGVVFESTVAEQFDTPGNSIVYHTIYLKPRSGGSISDGNLPQTPSGSWNDTVINGFVAVDASTLVEATLSVYVVVTRVSGNEINMMIINDNPFSVRFATTGNSPALRVAGQTVRTWEPQTGMQYNQGSIDRYGVQTLPLQPNRWRNDLSSLEAVGSSLLGGLKNPISAVTDIPVFGDPRLQCNDVVEVQDLSGLGGPIRLVAVGTRTTLTTGNNGGIKTELAVKPYAPPGAWILGDPVYSILGSTTYLT